MVQLPLEQGYIANWNAVTYSRHYTSANASGKFAV